MSVELDYQEQLADQLRRHSIPDEHGHYKHNLFEAGAFDVAERIMLDEQPLWMQSVVDRPYTSDTYNVSILRSHAFEDFSVRIEKELVNDIHGDQALVERTYLIEDGCSTLFNVTTVVKQISHGRNGSGYYIFSQNATEAKSGKPIRRTGTSDSLDNLMADRFPIRSALNRR